MYKEYKVLLLCRFDYGKHQFGIVDAVAGEIAQRMDFEAERAFRRIVMNIGNRLGAKVRVDPRKGDDPRRILLHRGDHALVLDSIVRVRIGFRKPHNHVDAIGIHIVERAGLIPTCTCWSITK